MKYIRVINLIIVLAFGFENTLNAQYVPVSQASKILVGPCNAACQSNKPNVWVAGSIVRWRIGVANLLRSDALGLCTISDQLPPGFTYVGNERYWLGHLSTPSMTANDPSCCSLLPSIPPQVGANTFIRPVTGDNTLTWKFESLPGCQTLQSSSPNFAVVYYFVIEFDVLVGNVAPGSYCNFFTLDTKTRISPNAGESVELLPSSAVSNLALVTISPSASGTGSSAAIVKNPYLTGEKGNWYPTTTWSFLTGRERSIVVDSPQTNIRVDGIFVDYKNFWKHNGTLWKRSTLGWQWVETVTKKDVNGLTLESRDVLDRHNSLMTGYKNKLVVAEAGNARINEILFDGFEDWDYLALSSNCDTTQQCVPRPLNLDNYFVPDMSESHSGRYAGRLESSGKAINFPIVKQPPFVILHDALSNIPQSEVEQLNNFESLPNVDDVGKSRVNRTTQINKQTKNYNPVPNPAPLPSACVGTFQLLTNKSYVISAWVRDASNPLAINFDAPYITVGSSAFYTSGNIIDGWQRIYGEFTTSATPSTMSISFVNGIGATWFDDIRIFPFDAKMITHVYDGNTQKLTFTSDENNYFTKYNYDAANNLESISKETEKGVQTIKEARSANAKR